MKKYRFLIFIVSIVYFIVMLSDSSSAQGNSITNPRAKTPLQNFRTSTDSAGTSLKSNALENLRNRSISEIDRRITALNEALVKLSSLKKVSDTAKSTLTSLIQAEIAKLTELKSKIQADTDLATLRADAKSVATSHRTFALFLPQVRLLTAADALNNSATKMGDLAAKLETRINEASTSGQNTTELGPLLSKMKTNISDAQTQADAVIAAVTPLTPDGYPANRTTLISAKQNLQQGHKSLKAASQNARSIISKLLVMSVGNRSGEENSSSASSLMKPGDVSKSLR